jgi:hypothetical protein
MHVAASYIDDIASGIMIVLIWKQGVTLGTVSAVRRGFRLFGFRS